MAVLYAHDDAPLLATDGKTVLDTGAAAGSAEDFAARLRALLPRGWFPDPVPDIETEQAPVLAAVLSGFGTVLAGIRALMEQAARQTRLATMQGAFLDMAAADYFGADGLSRESGESDSAYLARIRASLVAARNTRQAVQDALEEATGVAPVIIEPMNAQDCHAYASAVIPAGGGGYGYGSSGLRYGTLSGGQFFVETAPGRAASARVIQDVIDRTASCGVTGWVKVEA